MKSTFSLCCAALLLLAGCRSQQTAFRFEPSSVSGGSGTGAQAAEAPVAAAVAPPASSGTAVLRAPTAKPAAGRRQVPLRRRLPTLRAVQPLAAATTAAMQRRPETASTKPLRRPRQAQLEHTAAFVLGAALIAAGMVGGIVLGGWLGLGVGALVVLLGYYFVGVGIGGKHAWLEVFQEFFNM